MTEIVNKLDLLMSDLEKTTQYLRHQLSSDGQKPKAVQIYTHIDADGITASAIIGKALYREQIPFQIRVLRQLEREEIVKIAQNLSEINNVIIFTDFGSGQYLELQKLLKNEKISARYIILDHHLPQKVNNKQELEKIEEIRQNTLPWHVNPYYYGIDGSIEISGAGMAYMFSKALNEKNKDLSAIALIGAIGDIQNQGKNKSFIGINKVILQDAIELSLVEKVDDLSFSSIKPLNEAIAYSSDFELAGISGNPNNTLKFLQMLGILMEDTEGNVRTLNNLTQDEKQKVSSAIIEYATIKIGMELGEVIEKLIVNKYILKKEPIGTELYDINDFSNLLNACGRNNKGSLGIAIAMGNRKTAFQEAKNTLSQYKKMLTESLNWIQDEEKIQQLEHVQYFFGENVIPENIIGTISSMMVFSKFPNMDLNKPLFGCAKRKDEDVYKISGRAAEVIVELGVNLSEAIRDACEIMKLDVLGGGHPPAAGTKIPTGRIDEFLKIMNDVIEKQLKHK